MKRRGEEYLFGRLSSEKRRELEAHFDQCVPCRLRKQKVQHQITELKTALHLHELIRSTEKRLFPRTSARGGVILRLASRRKGSLAVHGRLKDKCPGGIGLVCYRRYRVGTRVLVACGGKAMCGIVRYCRPYSSSYRVGIEISAA